MLNVRDVPRPFKYRPELYKKMIEDPRAAYPLMGLIAFDSKSNLPDTAWKSQTFKMAVRKVDHEAYQVCNDFQNNVVKNISNGRGLFINGTYGSGKTTWAYRIAVEYMERLAPYDINSFPVYYVNVPALLSTLKLNFNNDEETRKIHHAMENAHLVIFDDMGAENNTEWANEVLYTFVNKRYEQGKANIFTSNIDINNLTQERIRDRILETCEIVEFKGSSMRTKI